MSPGTEGTRPPHDQAAGADRLAGQVAVVTGASSGLGRRFAEVLAAHGAAVAVVARRADRLDELVSELTDVGARCAAIPADLADPDAPVAAIARAEELLGPVSILVNNAGIPDAAHATKVSSDLYERLMGVNVRAPFQMSCEVARRAIARKEPARIVNLSSMAAFNYGGNGAALYSMSKAAVVRMTEVLAVEWARFGINVNGIAPGAFASEMMDGMLERVGDMSQHFPRRRLPSADKLDSTLLYLVSPDSEYVTGAVIPVDDGQMPR